MDFKAAKILFMGTPKISATLLEKMIIDGYNIIGLVCQKDKPVGRKNIITPCPTKEVALKYGIKIFQPEKIRLDFDFVNELKPDVILTFAYGQIIPQAMLDIPTIGSINLHGSLLPKYRGSAPIQWAIINGENKTGITLMKMVKEMDAGCMYAKEEIVISSEDNNSTLFEKMSLAAYEVVRKYLPLYIDGKLKGIEQNQNEVTFAPMISKEMEKLDLSLPVNKFVAWVKGLAMNPGGYLLLDGRKFKIYDAKVFNNSVNGKLGEILKASPKEGLLLQGSDGVISLLLVQEEGKKILDYKSFTNGNRDIVSKILY